MTQKKVSVLECKNEELEQYGRRLCLRIGASSDGILDKVKSLIMESERGTAYVIIDRVHRISKGHKAKTRKAPCKSIIVRFSRFRHMILFYRNRNKLKYVKVWLDITKEQ